MRLITRARILCNYLFCCVCTVVINKLKFQRIKLKRPLFQILNYIFLHISSYRLIYSIFHTIVGYVILHILLFFTELIYIFVIPTNFRYIGRKKSKKNNRLIIILSLKDIISAIQPEWLPAPVGTLLFLLLKNIRDHMFRSIMYFRINVGVQIRYIHESSGIGFLNKKSTLGKTRNRTSTINRIIYSNPSL